MYNMSREKEDKNIGYKRAFLNEPYMTSTTSCISYYVKLRSWHKELEEEPDFYHNASILFSMSDCSRNISLDFDISTKAEMRNSLHKLDTIINTCVSMKEDIKKARLEILKGEAKVKEVKELEKKE